MLNRYHLYLGKAGQFMAMSEFLARGWNVAVPEVDVGDDIFVVKDEDGEFSRVQVKTSSGSERNKGFSARFNIPLEQLSKDHTPELYYVFVTRFENHWGKCLVISRSDLFRFYSMGNFGSTGKNKKHLILYFAYHENRVTCSRSDLSSYLNNFEDFPVILH